MDENCARSSCGTACRCERARARAIVSGCRSFADLGDWGESELRSEYDPSIPEIRINLAVAVGLPHAQLGEFVALAVGHELYHHREHLREIPVLRDRCARESAAAAYARELLRSHA